MGDITYDKSKGEPIFVGEYFTFDMYFASLAAMQLHPGVGRNGHVGKSLEECKDMAIEMLKLRRSIPVFEPIKTEVENGNG